MRFQVFKYLFGLLLLCQGAQGFATTLYDVFSNESIEVSNHSEDVVAKQDFIKGEFDLGYFRIKGDKYPFSESINKQIFDLCKDYVDSEDRLIGHYRQIKERVNNFHKLQNSQNSDENGYYYDDDSDDKISLSLHALEAEAVSYVSNMLFFKVEFVFSLEDRQYKTVGFKYNVYFKIDLGSGSITELNNDLEAKTNKRIQSILAPRINENYALIRSKMDAEDLKYLFYESEVDSNKIIDVSKRIDFNEAKYFWMGWGLMITFENYSKSSLLYSGYSFSIFVPLEETKDLIPLLPDFSFVQNIVHPSNGFTNMNYQNYLQEKTNYRPSRDATGLISNVSSNRLPKSVTIDRYQLLKDTVMNFRGKEYNEFDEKGNLTKKVLYSDDKSVYRTESCKYNTFGNLESRFQEASKKGKDAEVDIYLYDRKGNLAMIKSVSSSDVRITYYFYNGKHIYSWRQEWFDEGRMDRVNKVFVDDKKLCVSNSCYLLDADGKLKSVTSDKYVTRATQIGRDEKGRIVEVHGENDRYNTYYYYDKLDRLYKHQAFDSQKLGTEGNYTFHDNQLFPRSFKSVRLSGGQKTVLVDDYQWDFFE